MLGDFEIVPLDGVSIERTSTDAGERVRIVAERDLVELATGHFSRPSVGVRWSSQRFARGIEFCGFALTQFALPVVGDAALDFDFTPSDGVRSPSAVLPLIARTADTAMLLAPLIAAHEQVIAVRDGALAWGWHGDLEEVPAGFATELGLYRGDSVTEVLAAWSADLTPTTDRVGDNPLTTHLSYWTDNGAAYWYRTEAGRSIVDSIVDAVRELRAEGIPIRSVELDSWWYQHETPPPIVEIGYPRGVPPSGTMRWEPRADAFGPPSAEVSTSILGEVSDRLDGAPLALHARHLSPRSPYIADGLGRGETWWVDELAAHPADPAFFRRWFDDAAANGVTVIEQDWMLMFWFWVRELRAHPGRARDWQRAMNGHAAATGVDLLWCMATPADFVEAAHLDRVIAVRTSDDYRFADDPAELWTWFLTVNRLAHALGLPVFKDVFFSNADVGPDDDPIDGDPHAELEAALAALSGGVVGVGDRRGRADPGVVLRTCDDDGRIRRVDRPIAFVDDAMFGAPARGESLAWATTTSTTSQGTWTYVLAINTSSDRSTIADTFDLGDRRAVLEWRTGVWSTSPSIEVTLAPRDWSLAIVAPPHVDVETAAEIAVDVDRYVVVEADPV